MQVTCELFQIKKTKCMCKILIAMHDELKLKRVYEYCTAVMKNINKGIHIDTVRTFEDVKKETANDVYTVILLDDNFGNGITGKTSGGALLDYIFSGPNSMAIVGIFTEELDVEQMRELAMKNLSMKKRRPISFTFTESQLRKFHIRNQTLKELEKII